MADLPTYVVSIERRVRDDYEIQARSPQDATFRVATHIANGGEPTRHVELSRVIKQPKVVLSDDIVPPEVSQ